METKEQIFLQIMSPEIFGWLSLEKRAPDPQVRPAAIPAWQLPSLSHPSGRNCFILPPRAWHGDAQHS